MSKIIDWEYYSSHFPNVVPEKQFDHRRHLPGKH